jgi:hypothetical protein
MAAADIFGAEEDIVAGYEFILMGILIHYFFNFFINKN